MKKNHSPFAVVEIGGGIICFLIGISGFLQHVDFLLIIQILFLGVGLLLYGLTNNNTDKSERGKMLSNIASIFMIIVGILSFYNYFYNSK
jgi:predicted membrane protein